MTDRMTKCFSGVLMSYQWEIEFCYRGSKLQDLIRNLQQITRHSAISSKSVRSNCFYLGISLPGTLGLLMRRKAPSYQKVNMPWVQGHVFSYSVKIEFKLLT